MLVLEVVDLIVCILEFVLLSLDYTTGRLQLFGHGGVLSLRIHYHIILSLLLFSQFLSFFPLFS